MNRLMLFLPVCSALPLLAADLKESRFTQVVNEVKVVAMPVQETKPARIDDIFLAPNILRTGPQSRAELIAADRTITRVGANSSFSFDQGTRSIFLEKGSLLFHSPKGKGGGTIRTGAATAAVLGTTLIVSTTEDGGFKVLVLEGKAEVKLFDGQRQTLNAGQMTFVTPGSKQLVQPINYRVETQVKGSRLVNGFARPLPSVDKIEKVQLRQEEMIKRGKAEDTGLLVGGRAHPRGVPVYDPDLNEKVVSKGSRKRDLKKDIKVRDRLGRPRPGAPAEPGAPVGENPQVVVGRDIDFGNGQGQLNVGLEIPIDATSFGVVAGNDVSFQQDTRFDSGGNNSLPLTIDAGGSIDTAPGTDITYSSTAGVFFDAKKEIQWLDSGIQNPQGAVSLSASDLHLIGSDFTGNPLMLSSDRDMMITGGALNSRDIKISAGGSAQLDRVALNSDSLVGRFAATSGQTLGISAVSFSGFSQVGLAAHTIALQNVSFAAGSEVALQSFKGQLSVGTFRNGYVNFLNNVTYGGAPAQNFVGYGSGSAMPIKITDRLGRANPPALPLQRR